MLTSDSGLPDCVWNSVAMKCPPGVEAPTFLNCARTQVLGPIDGSHRRPVGNTVGLLSTILRRRDTAEASRGRVPWEPSQLQMRYGGSHPNPAKRRSTDPSRGGTAKKADFSHRHLSGEPGVGEPEVETPALHGRLPGSLGHAAVAGVGLIEPQPEPAGVLVLLRALAEHLVLWRALHGCDGFCSFPVPPRPGVGALVYVPGVEALTEAGCARRRSTDRGSGS